MPDFIVVIPARYASTRLPGKPLLDILGKTMIQRVWEQAKKSSAKAVYIATDDQRIAEQVEQFGGDVVMTEANHPSGTDRLQEAVSKLDFDDADVVVNVQGDEPLIPPEVIDQVAKNIVQSGAAAATLGEAFESMDMFLNPNAVKVVNDANGFASYFSRAPIPWARDAFAQLKGSPSTDAVANEKAFEQLISMVKPLRHIGIYAYKVSLLKKFVLWPMAPLEKVECLEQLRILHNGEKIHVEEACALVPGGIDTREDLDGVCAYLANAQNSV
jgi:3-deoxy-manno-octulosonate cytidylyltransferase (CMP-KDO synthetase)